MKKGQTLKDNAGYEVLLFPMEYMNITQGNNGKFSHQGVNALDLAGKDAGIDETIAPCSMKLVGYDSYANGNAVFFESTGPVELKKGYRNYVTMMYIHDNYIGDITSWAAAGHIWKQGETFGDEGTAGFATGNHCHFEIAEGKYTGHFYDRNSQHVWHLPNSVSADTLCFTNGTVMMNNGQPSGSGNKMNWKAWEGWKKNATGWWYLQADGKYPAKTWKYLAIYQGLNLTNPGEKRWYYFDERGYMCHDKWIKHTDGKWYYLGSGGDMRTNEWIKWGKKWYYVGKDGVMYEDCEKEINGKMYKFDKSGAWIENE